MLITLDSIASSELGIGLAIKLSWSLCRTQVNDSKYMTKKPLVMTTIGPNDETRQCLRRHDWSLFYLHAEICNCFNTVWNRRRYCCKVISRAVFIDTWDLPTGHYCVAAWSLRRRSCHLIGSWRQCTPWIYQKSPLSCLCCSCSCSLSFHLLPSLCVPLCISLPHWRY